MRVPRHIARGLRRHDRRVKVRWDPQVRRWQLVEWLCRVSRWSHILYWVGPSGEFRSLGSLEPILQALGRCDFEKFGQSARSDDGIRAWSDQMEGKRTAWIRRRREAYALVLEEFRDMNRRFRKEVVVSGPGGQLRARQWLRKEGLMGADVEQYLATLGG